MRGRLERRGIYVTAETMLPAIVEECVNDGASNDATWGSEDDDRSVQTVHTASSVSVLEGENSGEAGQSGDVECGTRRISPSSSSTSRSCESTNDGAKRPKRLATEPEPHDWEVQERRERGTSDHHDQQEDLPVLIATRTHFGSKRQRWTRRSPNGIAESLPEEEQGVDPHKGPGPHLSDNDECGSGGAGDPSPYDQDHGPHDRPTRDEDVRNHGDMGQNNQKARSNVLHNFFEAT